MTNRIAFILSLLPIAALTGCAGVTIDCPGCGVGTGTAGTLQPPPPPPPHVQVAHVSNIFGGSNAFVGSTRASINQPIFLGEHFFTGAGTKMEVTIEDGGTVLLDQNTDPGFFTVMQCFWIRLSSGAMTVTNKKEMCVDAGGAKVTQHSYVLYTVHGGQETVAVFEGSVTLRSPPGYTLTAGQILVLQNGRPVGPPRQMSQDEINRLQAWIPRVIL